MEDATGEHEATANGAAVEVLVSVRKAVEIDIVGAKDEDGMDASHAEEEGDNGQGHDAVLDEQALGANVAACDAQENNGEAEDGAPPAHKQGRLDLCKGHRGRCVRIEAHGCKSWQLFGNSQPRNSRFSARPVHLPLEGRAGRSPRRWQTEQRW